MNSDGTVDGRWLPPARDYTTAADGRSTWMASRFEPAALPPIVATGPDSFVGRWMTGDADPGPVGHDVGERDLDEH